MTQATRRRKARAGDEPSLPSRAQRVAAGKAARSGDRVAIAAYLGSGPTFERAIGAFARAYADQNEDDHQKLVEAISAGRIVAETGL
jgi:hypothetical protein